LSISESAAGGRRIREINGSNSKAKLGSSGRASAKVDRRSHGYRGGGRLFGLSSLLSFLAGQVKLLFTLVHDV